MTHLILDGNSLTIRDVIVVAHARPDEITLALSPLVIGYTVYVYRVFRGEVRLGEDSY